MWFAQVVDSERELAAACARGDEGAWLELIRRYDRTVVRVLWHSGAREDADDLRQETYARLLARDGATLKSFRADRASRARQTVSSAARNRTVCPPEVWKRLPLQFC